MRFSQNLVFVILEMKTSLISIFWGELVTAYGNLNPPYIRTMLGSTVRFYCGTSETVTWRLDGKELPPNVIPNRDARKNWIDINYVRSFNNGQYSCLHTFTMIPIGLGVLEIINLKRKHQGKVDPERLIVYKGTPQVHIDCFSSTSVSWVKSNGNHMPSSSILPNNTLVLVNVKNKDSDNYTCIGTVKDKSFSATSEVLVGVEDNSNIHPSVIKRRVGSSAIFACTSYYDTLWFLNEQKDPLSQSKDIVINSVSYQNAGTYICYGTYKNPAKHFVAKAELKVYGDLIHPPVRVARIRSTTTFLCMSAGKAKWYHNDTKIQGDFTTITLHKINIDDRGTYECQGITQDGGIFYAIGILKILIRDETRVSPHYQQAFLGSDRYFTCISRNKVTWKFSKELPANVVQEKKNNKYILTIFSASAENSGLYTCQAEETKNIIYDDEGVLEVFDDYGYFNETILSNIESVMSPMSSNNMPVALEHSQKDCLRPAMAGNDMICLD